MSTIRKLNRSFSESELHRLNFNNLSVQDFNSSNIQFERNMPYIKKTVLIVEQVFHNSSVVLRTGHSIPNQLHDIENICPNSCFLNSSTANSDTTETKLPLEVGDIYLSHDKTDGIVPMEVDVSCNNFKTEEHSVEEMDVDSDYNPCRTERLNSLDVILRKRRLKRKDDIFETVPLKHKTQIKSISYKKRHFLRNSVIVVILVFSLILLNQWLFQASNKSFDEIQLEKLENELLENVYEQKNSINIVIQSLEHQYQWLKKIKVLGFVGSAGVGKTFVANTLKKHFNSELVHELYGIQLNFKREWENILNKLKVCCLNLIIIDDLNKNDLIEFLNLVHSLPKNVYILVVSIFSIQDSDNKLNYIINYDDVNEIKQQFDNAHLFYELAIFNQFNLDQVKDWLAKQLKVQNVSYSEKLINNVLCNHNALYEGLKGLYAKLLLELEATR